MAFYSKQRKLLKSTYYVTASAVLNGGSVIPPPAGKSEFIATSGSWVYTTRERPKKIVFNVPDHGKLLDVTVWIELIHENRLAYNTDDPQASSLGSLTLTIRNPNIRFGSGQPTWNDPKFSQNTAFFPNVPDSGSLTTELTYVSAEIYRDAYVLWDGAFPPDNGYNPAYYQQLDFPTFNTWDYDMDMRTVFSDRSRVVNPRNIESVFPSANESITGDPSGTVYALTSSMPWAQVFATDRYPPELQFFGSPVNGRRVPWLWDRRLVQPGITGTSNFTGTLGNSPPPGWLTGPGGTSAATEFPTTGTQLGPADMQPVYPLMDDVIVRNVYNDLFGGSLYTGFRPGLRGVDMQGRWELMIGMHTGSLLYSGLNSKVSPSGSGVWFRQARLELTYDQGEGVSLFNPVSDLRYKKPGTVLSVPGKRRIHITSGSSVWEQGVSYVYSVQPDVYGRTVGITEFTGSARDSFAVFTRLTGSLLDSLSPDQVNNIRAHFLKNEFSTPFIPLSSGSGVDPSFEPFSKEEANDSKLVFNQTFRPDVLAQRGLGLRSTLSRTGFYRTTADRLSTNIGNISGSA